MNIAVNTSYPGAVKQERKRCSSDDRESGTLTLAGIGGTLQFYWRCCKHHQCSAPFHEMRGRRAAGMVFNLRNQIQVVL